MTETKVESFVTKTLNLITESELQEAAKEIFDWHNTTILKNGVIRKYSDLLKLQGIPDHVALGIVEKYILESCTKRYLAISALGLEYL